MPRAHLRLAGLLLIAFNLRPALASVSPLLEVIRADLHLGYAGLSLLTVLPVLCMGVFPVPAAHLAGRIGAERGVLAAVVLVALAIALRVAGGNAPLLFGTALLAGIGIAAAQTLLPAVIKQHFPDRAVLIISLYSTIMTIGAGFAAALAVPLTRWFGSWPVALAVWSLPALLACAVWLPVAGRPGAGAGTRFGATRLPWRSRLAWLITLFSGASFSLFWSVLTWLAPAYREQGVGPEQAGLLLSLATAVQVASSLLISALAARSPDRRPWFALCLVVGVFGFAGIGLFPAVAPAWFWAVLIGIGIGAIFPLTLVLPLDFASDPASVGRLTAMSLSVGYLFAAVGPFLMGWLRGLSGGFAAPFLGLALLCCAMLAVVPALHPARSVESRE